MVKSMEEQFVNHDFLELLNLFESQFCLFLLILFLNSFLQLLFIIQIMF